MDMHACFFQHNIQGSRAWYSLVITSKKHPTLDLLHIDIISNAYIEWVICIGYATVWWSHIFDFKLRFNDYPKKIPILPKFQLRKLHKKGALALDFHVSILKWHVMPLNSMIPYIVYVLPNVYVLPKQFDTL